MWLNKIKTTAAALTISFATAGIGAGFFVSAGHATEAPSPQQTENPRQRIAELRDRLQIEEKEHERRIADLKSKIADLERQARRQNVRPIDPKQFLAERFKFKVPVEIGETKNSPGYRIEILEVLGTQPQIQIGGVYIVRGRYVMATPRQANIYFYESANGPNGVGPNMDLQSTKVSEAEGEFTLMHTMRGSNAGAEDPRKILGLPPEVADVMQKYGTSGPGYFHLQLHTDGPEFADMYFGTGDNVLRKK
jgi:hypothetical protein